MFIVPAVFALVFASQESFAFTIKEFHPQGLSHSPRQVRVVFSEPMIPFGDPRGIEPFEVKCSQLGKGLWEDSRTWIYEFPKQLSSGESCSFTAIKAIKSEKGGVWQGKMEFTFDTGGPAVKKSEPYEGSIVEQQPAFLLQLDGAVDNASVEKNAYILVEGLPERIPLKVLGNKIRDEIAKNSSRGNGGDEESGSDELKGGTMIAVAPARTLPPDARIQLVWGKGIRAPQGAATAQDQLFAFRSQKEFTAEFQCERENANAACLPIGGMSVQFSAPVARKEIEEAMVNSGKFRFKPAFKEKDDFVQQLRFPGPFSPNTLFRVELPNGLKDDGGRLLANRSKFPLEVRTGDYPPLAKFPAPFGIVEAKDPVLPVTLRGVEPALAATKIVGSKVALGPADPAEIMNWVFRLQHKHNNYQVWKKEKEYDTRGDSLLASVKGRQNFVLPKPNGTQAFEVLGIPLGEKGFHIIEVESKLLGRSLLGKNKSMYVASGALVTNLAVHLKWGVENSLVWVTFLDSGKPVRGAKLRAVDCSGKVVWQGETDAAGTALAGNFPALDSARQCQEKQDGSFKEGLVVLAEQGGDFSIVHSGWNNGIESWRFRVPTGAKGDENIAHTVFDRTLLRAGQTVHMKHFLRERYLRGIRYTQKLMPKTVVLLHSSGQKIVMPVKFNASGVAESEWKIPKEADLGGYTVYLSMRDEAKADRKRGSQQGPGGLLPPEQESFQSWAPGVYESGSFRVEEFRVPVTAGSMQWASGQLVGEDSVSVDLSVRYLSGGAAAGLPVVLRSRAERLEGLNFPAFENFSFANGGLGVGRVRRSESSENDDEKNKNEKIFPAQKLTLDQNGGARITVKGLPAWDQPARLSLEAEYHDPNGEIRTVSRGTTLFPAPVLVGIEPDGWVAQKEQVKFKVAVVSPDGKPLAGRKVKVEWLERQNYSHRKRIVGGFYAYENFEEIKEKGQACAGSSNEQGVLFCEGKAPGTGNLVLVAEVEQEGHKSRAHHDLFIAGADEWWFGQENDDRIDLLPEKKAYEPGESARFQVRSPFRSATVLVTIEREGVIDRFVREIEGKNPVLEVPIKESYAPNVFISALLVRGRVGDPQATALVDLGRPAHKLGIAEVAVGWKAHRLSVAVAADKAEYKVREKAKVKVHVERSLDGRPAAKGEVLLLAIDEALLELLPNHSWDLLDAMMGKRSLKVQTSTAQSQVIGKRHFGVKALPPGGGGGQSSARELFDTLLFWKATVPLNATGDAEAEIPMNDSLSSFRIVAIASEGADRFGTGTHSVRTRQDLMLFSGVAPLARHGDKAYPEVTLRNSSDKPLKAEVRAEVNGEPFGSAQAQLAPGAAETFFWPQTVPAKGTQQEFTFEASSGDSHDLLKFTQKLEPALKESVLQATLERVEGKFSMPIQRVKGSLPGSGGITAKLERSIAANLDSVGKYMSEYPFGCLEQQVSRAVVRLDRGPGAADWKAIANKLSSYTDSSGLLKYFPESNEGSDTLTSYVLSITNEAGFSLPANELKRVIAGLQGFVSGTYYYTGFVYPAADLAIRKLAAMEALSRYQSFDPAYLGLIHIQPELWPMRALLDWYNLLKRERKIPDRENRLTHAEQLIRSKLEWRGSVLAFKGGVQLWWLMSSMDEDANRLLLLAASDEHWNEDIGRLVRGTIARQLQGHWDLTTANAWGVLAMERFSQRHEKVPVTGVSESSLAGQTKQVRWSGGKTDRLMFFPWPETKSELTVAHHGAGRPWALLEARAAVKLAEPIFKGYRLKRSITAVEQKRKGLWSTGDVYRVTLAVEAPADMTWVAISDPIPAGASVLGSGLGGDSAMLVRGEKQKNYGTFEERSFSGFRSYFEFLPKGSHRIEYTVRLNGAGIFQLPNSRVEAMYAPEMFAEVPNDEVVVVR